MTLATNGGVVIARRCRRDGGIVPSGCKCHLWLTCRIANAFLTYPRIRHAWRDHSAARSVRADFPRTLEAVAPCRKDRRLAWRQTAHRKSDAYKICDGLGIAIEGGASSPVTEVLEGGGNQSSYQVVLPRLSPRQKSIVRCLVYGDTNKVIARKTNLSEATVKVHIKTILRKLTSSQSDPGGNLGRRPTRWWTSTAALPRSRLRRRQPNP